MGIVYPEADGGFGGGGGGETEWVDGVFWGGEGFGGVTLNNHKKHITHHLQLHLPDPPTSRHPLTILPKRTYLPLIQVRKPPHPTHNHLPQRIVLLRVAENQVGEGGESGV